MISMKYEIFVALNIKETNKGEIEIAVYNYLI
jgi:hypothetical protein